jgi:hypothetical protein
MDKVQIIDCRKTAPSSKTFGGEYSGCTKDGALFD